MNLAEIAERVHAAAAHLPNGTACPSCQGTGRRETEGAKLESIRRWLWGGADTPGETEPCPRCKATGARHCDYGCGRIAVAIDIITSHFECEVCATLGDTEQACCECTWSTPDEVSVDDDASFSCGFWHRRCGKYCCSQECADAHEVKCLRDLTGGADA